MERTIKTLEVFVSTTLLNDGTSPTQQRFDLVDYEDKDCFMNAATDAMVAITDQPNPQLVFTSLDDSFNASGLLTENDINEGVWFLFKRPDSAISVYEAYCSCFETADYTLKAQLYDISTSYFGCYDDDEALIEAYLQHHQLPYEPLTMVMTNLDLPAMADMIKSEIAYHEDHFFI